MEKTVILAGGYNKDGHGSLDRAYQYHSVIQNSQAAVTELIIDPLRAGWNTPVKTNHFRSGCAPLMALDAANQLISRGDSEVVVIRGKDFLRTGYDPQERRKLMSVYGENNPLPELYTDLASVFMDRHNIDTKQFKLYAGLLFENYCRTARSRGINVLPEARWYQNITRLFRGVDCTNPTVDFEGCLVLSSESFARTCGVRLQQQIALLGIAVEEIEDGPENLAQIAAYTHTEQAYLHACDQAGIDVKQAFLADEALMEVYTCYPVVPLGFLLSCGFVRGTKELKRFLSHHEITVTGGMNLARGAWNNPSLTALIVMFHELQKRKQTIGLVHGNGGLGYRQGIAILGRTA